MARNGQFLAAAIAGVVVLTTTEAVAGAWPQERGHGFASTDTRLSRPQNALRDGDVSTYNTLYLEYGLTDRITLGLDLGRSVSGDDKAVAFVRYPLASPIADTRLAFELGVGRIGKARVVRPGLSLGRSFVWRDQVYGWLSADALAEINRDNGRVDYKLDLTVGVTFANQRKFFVQLQSGAPHGREPFLRVAPSIVLPIGRNRHAEIGLSIGLKGDDQLGIKFGLWQEF